MLCGLKFLYLSSRLALGTIHLLMQKSAISEAGEARERTFFLLPNRIFCQFLANGMA